MLIRYDLIYPGLIICVPVTNVSNKSSVPTYDAIVTLHSIPEGLEFSSANVDRGTFDELSLIWNTTFLSSVDSLNALFCFKVLDDSKAPFKFTFEASLSGECASCNGTKYYVTVDGLTVTELVTLGSVVVAVGFYDDDAHAAANGVQIGQYYKLSATNTLGLPEGTVKMRYV